MITLFTSIVSRLYLLLILSDLCYPTPPATCTPISVDVTATHRSTATQDEVKFALLRQSEHLPAQIDVPGYIVDYVGDRTVETKNEITIAGVPDREMEGYELEFFEKVARDFLTSQVTDDSENNSVEILGLTVNGQDITASANSFGSSPSVVPDVRSNSNRRLQKTNKVEVSVRGKCKSIRCCSVFLKMETWSKQLTYTFRVLPQ